MVILIFKRYVGRGKTLLWVAKEVMISSASAGREAMDITGKGRFVVAVALETSTVSKVQLNGLEI